MPAFAVPVFPMPTSPVPELKNFYVSATGVEQPTLWLPELKPSETPIRPVPVSLMPILRYRCWRSRYWHCRR